MLFDDIKIHIIFYFAFGYVIVFDSSILEDEEENDVDEDEEFSKSKLSSELSDDDGVVVTDERSAVTT